MRPSNDTKQPVGMPSGVVVLGLPALGALIACLVWGWDYYTSAESQRPFHDGFGLLRPGGGMGLIWGVVGAALIVFNLSYLIRRYLAGWHWLGSLRLWLSFHMMTGVVAAMAAILHSTLIVSSPLAALAFWSLLLTVVTGLSGIIIYVRFSLSPESREMAGSEPSGTIKRVLQIWRFFHRWLAVLLLMALIFHVVTAIRFGGLWIWGGPS